MQSKLKKESGLKKEYEVTIPAKTISARTEKELENYSKKAKVAGFREGKVPVAIVKKRYGDSVNADVLDKIIKESAEKIFKDNDMTPAMEPKISPEKFEEGKDFIYTMEFEVFPKVPEFDFSKLKVEKLSADVTEKDIKEGLERIAKANHTFVTAAGRDTAKKGDQVIIDFTGIKDGTPFPGGKAEGFSLELGSGQFIPGFEEKVAGMKLAEEKTIKLTFPKEYHSADLAGAPVEFIVKLHEIKEAKEPKLDDEFAKQLGLESLDKLKEEIKKQIEADLVAVSFTKAKKELFDAIDTKHKFPVPEGMVDIDRKSVLMQMKQESPDSKDAELKAEADKLAERRVRLGIVLSELGKTNTINVTNDEIRQALWNKARGFPGQEQMVVEFYQKNPGAIDQLRGEILEDKVVKFLMDKVTIVDKKVSKEELLKDDFDADGGAAIPHGHSGHVHGPDCNH